MEQPKLPEEGYHFSVDITDKALSFIKDAKVVAPTSRSSSTTRFGAAHAPHHVPKEWADKYKGKFDMGYEAYRELVFANQKKLGIVPEHAELSPINPYTDLKGPTGQGWGELDVVRPWDSLSDDEKHLFSRMAEVYAGFLSHADDQLGRVLDYLEKSGQLDNTLIVLVSDNGASGEGGPNGSVNENKFFNGLPDTIEEALKYVDDLGSPKTYNHYPTGWAWAFNTPFKMWKRYASYQGGTADPMIVSWPAQIKQAGIRTQYTHAVDIAPTIYELLGIEMPEVVNGFTQHPLEGESFAASLHDAEAKGKQTQFYSMLGTRGDLPRRLEGRVGDACRTRCLGRLRQPALGAVQRGEPIRASATTSPRSKPEKLQELIALWWAEAGKYGALPLESRDAIGILLAPRPQLSKPRDRYVYYPDCAEVPESVTPNIRNRSYADRRRGDDRHAGGEWRPVLAGLALRRPCPLPEGRQVQVRLQLGRRVRTDRRVDQALPDRRHVLSAVLREGRRRRCRPRARSRLYIDDEKVGEGKIKTQPGKFSLAGEGLNVGKEGGEPVTDDYPGTLTVGVRRRHDPPGRRSTSRASRGSTSRRSSPAAFARD